MAEKNWEGCRGLRLTEPMRLAIAGQAAVLVVGRDDEYFDKLDSILVYSDDYVAPGQVSVGGGVVLEEQSYRSGEAWYRGPVVLTWLDVVAGGRGPNHGHNLVLHEFAHVLDMQNGRVADGVPTLDSADQVARWDETLSKGFRELQQRCDDGQPSLLDCYAATNRAEYFAVSTECFFQQPHALARWHPPWYELLTQFYRQDPASGEGGQPLFGL